MLSACTESIPEYSDILPVKSRSELIEKFGEPDTLISYPYLPDVISIREPSPATYSRLEKWAYASVKDGEPGKALFTFYTNDAGSVELSGELYWINNAEFATLAARAQRMNEPRVTWIGNQN